MKNLKVFIICAKTFVSVKQREHFKKIYNKVVSNNWNFWKTIIDHGIGTKLVLNWEENMLHIKT